MAWKIAAFPDQTVSSVSIKWIIKSGRKCYFPKKNVLWNIKTEAEVDKKSKNWSLHNCRILMNGGKNLKRLQWKVFHFIHSIEIFLTYEEARKAEVVAQNHSTMSSFENSNSQKQLARKRPNVIFDSSSDSSSDSENECNDFKNIKKLSKMDAGIVDEDKEYNYNRSNCSSDEAHSSVADKSFESDKDQFSGSARESSNASDDESSNASDNESSNASDDESNGSDGESLNGSDDNENTNESKNENFSVIENGNDESQRTEYESNFLGKNLESTAELRPLGSDYDFSDDRCMLRVEKLIMHVCCELKSIKTEISGLTTKSNETEAVVTKLVSVCKDLAVEVFACTEEIKKRNGMFTDILVPNLRLPVKRTKHYINNELALGDYKIVDNMVSLIIVLKYLKFEIIF